MWNYDTSGVSRPALKGPSLNPFSDSSVRNKFDSIQSNGGVMTIVCAGESTTKGLGSNGEFNSGNVHRYSWPKHLANSLRSRLGVQVSEVHIPPSTLSPNDSRWQTPFGFFLNTPGCANISTFKATSSNSVLTFKNLDTEHWDSATVWYLKAPSTNGVADISATGGISVSASAYAPSRFYESVTVKAADISNTNSVTIKTRTSDAFYVIAIELFDSTTSSRIRVANFGTGGTTTENWISDTGTGIKGWWPINMLNPDLTLVMMGGNESSAGVSATTHAANLTTLVNNINSGKVCILPPTPRNTAELTARVDSYVELTSVISGSNVINYSANLWNRWKTLSLLFWNGGVHLTGCGYKLISDYIEDLIAP